MDRRSKLLARYKNLIYADDDVSVEVIATEGQIVEAHDKIAQAQNTIEETKREIEKFETRLEKDTQDQTRVAREIAEVEALLAVPDKWLLLPVSPNDYKLWQQAKKLGVAVITNKWVRETFGLSAPTAGLRLIQAERAGLLEKLGPAKFQLRANVIEGPPPPVEVQKEVERVMALEEEISESMTADAASAPTAVSEATPAVVEAAGDPEGS